MQLGAPASAPERKTSLYGMTTPVPSFRPGDVRTRADIRAELGGSPYGGICPSKDKNTVLLFSDISSGEQYGYHDGWLREEDRLGPIFEYTGAGTRGDQTFGGDYGKGNSAILHHAADGRAIHVFIATGKVPGTDTKTHRYIGRFKVDEGRPYSIRQALDEDQKKRNVIVFRLRPIGDYYRADEDSIPPATDTRVTFVRSSSRRRLVPPKPRRKGLNLEESAATVAAREREELTSAYEEVLSEQQHRVGRLEVQIRGMEDTLLADLYDESENTLYEPSGSTSRQALKDALMQLLDISRYVNSTRHTMPLRRMVLLPALPGEDIRELLMEHNVGIIYRNENGGFSEFQSPQRGPGSGGAGILPCVDCPAVSA